MINRKQFWNIVYGFIAVFFLMFLLRLTYGYVTVPNGSTISNFFDGGSIFDGVRSNIASKSYQYKEAEGGQVINVDQKYEKIATLQAKTTQFDEDEENLRALIKSQEAIIQLEQKSGTSGNRNAKFQIGVQPDLFDTFLMEIEKIGTILNKDVSKKDKTNEYRELNAKRLTLEKTRSSLVDLKEKGGEIGEYINLENRILDIEDQLQSLGVSLGNYDKENEFCTVKYVLREGKETRISFVQRLKVALEWVIPLYAGIIFAFLCVLGCAYLILAIIGRLNLGNKMEE